MENKTDNKRSILRTFGEAIVFLSVVVGIIIYVENIVDRKINDPDYMQRLAGKVRPFLIANSEGIIEYNLGALEFIDSLKVEKLEITIYFNTFQQNAPLFEPLSKHQSFLSYKAERGKNKIWIITIAETGVDYFDKYKFRLEILR